MPAEIQLHLDRRQYLKQEVALLVVLGREHVIVIGRAKLELRKDQEAASAGLPGGSNSGLGRSRMLAPRLSSWAMTVVLVPAISTAAHSASGKVLIPSERVGNDDLASMPKAFQTV